ncbi:fucose 4-O-acetylase [Vibrio maritimus]|uniref:Fucose 4-O-acetylase n=1 Tax=Vibrio maritimus TaxID=990268 RepID=A0A090T7L1_9VIBR|nr:fucose 4-O-acetylase [Vibrio maritimus]
MLIWLMWSIIYLAVPFNLAVVMEHGYLAEREGYIGYLLQTPINTLFEGGMVHLWYIPSLALSVLIISWFANNKLFQLLLPVAAIVYVYGLIAGSYQVITDVEAPIFTRNGPFFALLMVAIGFEVRRNDWRMGSRPAVALALTGMMFHFTEAYFLHQKGHEFFTNDYLIGTVPLSVGLLFWLISNPNLGKHNYWHTLAKLTLPVYVCHILVAIIANNIAGFAGLSGPLRDGVVFSFTLVGSYILAYTIELTPLSCRNLRQLGSTTLKKLEYQSNS